MAALQLHVAAWTRNAKNKKKKSQKKKSKKDNSQRKQESPIRISNDANADGRVIGNLIVTSNEIASGSNGTIVFEGKYHGRRVAVKRLMKTHHNLVVNERNLLIASDQHANIVKFFGLESDQDFDYICLELCEYSLYDLILKNTGNGNGHQLWKDGFPSELLLKLMRDIVRGVAYLHKRKIVHRDLKPQDVLIVKDPSISAKISDLGMGEKLDGNKLYLTQNATGRGSSSWQPKEVLRNEPQTDAVDLFNLGCILFFCMMNGQHPFGEDGKRHDNIVHNKKNMSSIKRFPEAYDLISGLLQHDPKSRTKAEEAIHHPLFWDADTRMSFLRDVSDRVELEPRNSRLIKKLENICLGVGQWNVKMHEALLDDRFLHRGYDFKSVRAFLRLIRNTVSHYYDKLSEGSRKILGKFPEEVDRYFWSQFPSLLMGVYKVIVEHCANEERFSKYFSFSFGRSPGTSCNIL